MRFTLLGVPAKIPFSLFIVLPLLALVRGVSLFGPAAALLVHELGHILAARAMGEDLVELRIAPFGAALRLSGPPQSRCCEAFIAAAGPAASLLCATIAAGLMHFFPVLSFLSEFCRYCLALAAINFLPALPLDGGRVLRSVLRGFLPARPVAFASLLLGIVTAGSLIYLGLFQWPTIYPSALVFGTFLLIGSFSEWKRGPYNALSAVVHREAVFQRRGSMRLRTVALPAKMTAREALRHLDGATLIAVLDDSMHLLGTLAEGDLLRGMARGGAGIFLKDLL